MVAGRRDVLCFGDLNYEGYEIPSTGTGAGLASTHSHSPRVSSEVSPASLVLAPPRRMAGGLVPGEPEQQTRASSDENRTCVPTANILRPVGVLTTSSSVTRRAPQIT